MRSRAKRRNDDLLVTFGTGFCTGAIFMACLVVAYILYIN